MATSTGHVGPNAAGVGNGKRTGQTRTGEGRVAPRLTSEQVWRGLAKASFAATNPRLWVNAAVAVAMTAVAVRRHRRRHQGVGP
jgi:hypothetical protein